MTAYTRPIDARRYSDPLHAHALASAIAAKLFVIRGGCHGGRITKS